MQFEELDEKIRECSDRIEWPVCLPDVCREITKAYDIGALSQHEFLALRSLVFDELVRMH